MLLALIMATLTLGLLFSGWLTPTPTRAQTGQSNPQSNVETTNCVASSTSTNCTEATVTLSNVPTVTVCVGSGISASTMALITNGLQIIDTSYTNAGNSGNSSCPPDYTTNTPAPALGTNWWTASGCGISTNGPGLSIPGGLVATSCGQVTVTFNQKWTHTCDTNTAVASIQGTIDVIGVTADSVDASDPFNTVVNYTLKPGNLSGVAHFIAPGVDKTENVSSGFFQFAFNQHDLAKSAANSIALTVRVSNASGQTVSCATNISADVVSTNNTGNNIAFGRILMDIDGNPAAILVPITHYLTERYCCIAYSIPYSGETVWTSLSHAVINTPESNEIPSEIKSWTENHQFNSDPAQQMTVDTGPGLWPSGQGNWMDANLSTDLFYDPGVQGSATLDTLVFDDPAGPVFLQPSFVPPSNRTISVGMPCP